MPATASPSPASPSPSPGGSGSGSSSGSGGGSSVSVGAIVGGVVGGLVVAAAALAFVLGRRRRGRRGPGTPKLRSLEEGKAAGSSANGYNVAAGSGGRSGMGRASGGVGGAETRAYVQCW